MAYGFFRTYGIEVSDNNEDINYVSLGLLIVEVFIENV